MANEVRLWRVDATDSLQEIEAKPLDLEERLQRWIVQDISVLDETMLVIGREVPTGFGGFIDVLCMDIRGDLIVIELKRDRTPREVTAQILDYASWIADLSNEQVTDIAEAYLKGSLEEAFHAKFEVEIPDTLNEQHRLLIVGSTIDAATERIIKYLSQHYGVNMNAITFQYFTEPDGAELLARTFLLEPAQVEIQTRSRSASKRRPNATFEELHSWATSNGVGELYEHAVNAFEHVFHKRPRRAAMGFVANFDNRQQVVISLWPNESSGADGLHYQLYKHRFARLAGIEDIATLDELLPASREDWIYYPSAGTEYEGFQGFITTKEEIDRLARALSNG